MKNGEESFKKEQGALRRDEADQNYSSVYPLFVSVNPPLDISSKEVQEVINSKK